MFILYSRAMGMHLSNLVLSLLMMTMDSTGLSESTCETPWTYSDT